MDKIAVGPDCKGVIDINKSVADNLAAVAAAKGSKVRDLTAVILDRERHSDLIAEVRAAGARIRLIPDGDVAGAISTAWPDSGADIMFGIGGTPEGVIAAANAKCMGGEIQGKLWPRNDEAQRCARGGIRPRPGPHHRRAGRWRQLLLQRHRHHRRRAHQGCALLEARRHHAVARDAFEVGHGPAWSKRTTPPTSSSDSGRRRYAVVTESAER